jgi:hypothetical protein
VGRADAKPDAGFQAIAIDDGLLIQVENPIGFREVHELAVVFEGSGLEFGVAGLEGIGNLNVREVDGEVGDDIELHTLIEEREQRVIGSAKGILVDTFGNHTDIEPAEATEIRGGVQTVAGAQRQRQPDQGGDSRLQSWADHQKEDCNAEQGRHLEPKIQGIAVEEQQEEEWSEDDDRVDPGLGLQESGEMGARRGRLGAQGFQLVLR